MGKLIKFPAHRVVYNKPNVDLTDEEALNIANDSEYGLAAYVAGQNQEKLMYFARNLNAGQIHLNYTSGGSDAPFGGFKKSGNGREKAEWGLEEFLEVKAIMGNTP